MKEKEGKAYKKEMFKRVLCGWGPGVEDKVIMKYEIVLRIRMTDNCRKETL